MSIINQNTFFAKIIKIILACFPRSIKTQIKAKIFSTKLRYVRKWRSFSKTDFIKFLYTIGIKSGDVLLVHSSIRGFDSFNGKPLDIITAIKETIGTSGTLMMPNQPFTGNAVDWIRSGNIFDVAKTPSKVGLLTEIFRRMPDVYRSCHPTHPVAIWSQNAEDYIRDHHKSHTPCGKGTPYYHFGENNGKILLLSTGINAFTYYHCLEEILESEMPFSPFTSEVFEMQSLNHSKEIIITRNRLFDVELSGRRDMNLVVPHLKQMGAWHEARIGTLHAIMINAKDLKTACFAMARINKFCYHL